MYIYIEYASENPSAIGVSSIVGTVHGQVARFSGHFELFRRRVFVAFINVNTRACDVAKGKHKPVLGFIPYNKRTIYNMYNNNIITTIVTIIIATTQFGHCAQNAPPGEKKSGSCRRHRRLM